MLRTALAFFLLLATSVTATAASPSLLGLNYSEWFPDGITQIATDSSGALYLLGSYGLPSPACGLQCSASSVIKLSADGKTVLWQYQLGFLASAMAVSPAGDVFVSPEIQASDTAVYVIKLAAGGSGVAWKTAAGFAPSYLQSFPPILAADSQDRSYLAAPSGVNNSTVVRINAAGAAVDFSLTMPGWLTSIAADGSGSVVVAGAPLSTTGTDIFVARVSSDGSLAFDTVLSLSHVGWPALALDSTGNAVLYDGVNAVWRLDSSGSVTLSTIVPGSGGAFALDAAGNAYIVSILGQLYPVRNSLAPCLPSPPVSGSLPMQPTVGTAPLLTVVAPDGSIPQITYAPAASVYGRSLLAVGPNSSLFLATAPGASYTPTQTSPFPQGPPYTGTVLAQLSPQASVQTVALACLGNAATYSIGPVAPGEIVSLVGAGLGPEQGIETHATPQTPYPSQVSSVQVTFDGIPAPLLWVQDAQINAIVPWSLTPGTTTKLCVSSGATSPSCLMWPVAQTSPGVFTVDGVHAAALNQDGSINSADNPAAVGSIVSVFATGLGPISPSRADGSVVGLPLPSNVLDTAVESSQWTLMPPFGGGYSSVPVPVTYAGPAPHLVAGATQINFQLPSTPSLYLAPGGLNSIGLPASTTSQVFQVYVAAQ